MKSPSLTAGRETTWRVRILILIGLVALSTTQPALDALLRNDAYRSTVGIGWKECIGVAAFTTLVITPLVVVLDWIVVGLAARLQGRGRNAVIFALTCLVVLTFVRPYLDFRSVVQSRLTWLLAGCCTLPVSALVALKLERWKLLRQWMAVFAVGAVVFPATFTFQYLTTTASASKSRLSGSIRNPTSVVLVIFDEFSGLTLMNEEGKIDSRHYPGFARLADRSTWFRHATSSHARTDKAVPAILSSRVMSQNTPPEAAHYPGNLFELVDQSQAMGMTVFEPVTRLFQDHSIQPGQPHGYVSRVSSVIATLATVYPQLILPQDTPIDFPRTPFVWMGISEMTTPFDEKREGRIGYAWSLERERQLEHFLETIVPTDRPHLWFLHAGLPHYPWCLTPDGSRYLSDVDAEWPPPGGIGDIGEEWIQDPAEILRCEFRYRQQAGFVDRFVDQLQTQLESQGVWDSALVIVMADHGVAFRAGESRRSPDRTNLTELMSIPLFIKLPGQKEQRIDDRNAESIDVLPTIAEVLNVERDPRWQGVSLLSESLRLRKEFRGDNDSVVVVEPVIPRLKESLRRQEALFGNLAPGILPRAAMALPDLAGTPVPRSRIVDRVVADFAWTSGSHPRPEDRTDGFVPLLIQGRFDGHQLAEPASGIVAAINGEVIDSCRPQRTMLDRIEFHLVAPQRLAGQESAVLELFIVALDGTGAWERIYQGPL